MKTASRSSFCLRVKTVTGRCYVQVETLLGGGKLIVCIVGVVIAIILFRFGVFGWLVRLPLLILSAGSLLVHLHVI